MRIRKKIGRHYLEININSLCVFDNLGDARRRYVAIVHQINPAEFHLALVKKTGEINQQFAQRSRRSSVLLRDRRRFSLHSMDMSRHRTIVVRRPPRDAVQGFRHGRAGIAAPVGSGW